MAYNVFGGTLNPTQSINQRPTGHYHWLSCSNDSGLVVHTHVSLSTEQYNLILAEGW